MSNTSTISAPVLALAAHLGCDPSEVSPERFDHYDLPVFSAEGGEYAIGTDEEADAACIEYVRGSVWAFRARFILLECGLPLELEEAIEAFQSDKCEGANDALLELVEKCCKGGIEEFTESAISADGRGHFLSGYDGEENEAVVDGVRYFIYQIN